jgi:hypothetical protein
MLYDASERTVKSKEKEDGAGTCWENDELELRNLAEREGFESASKRE